jgi:hypothetical protein
MHNHARTYRTSIEVRRGTQHSRPEAGTVVRGPRTRYQRGQRRHPLITSIRRSSHRPALVLLAGLLLLQSATPTLGSIQAERPSPDRADTAPIEPIDGQPEADAAPIATFGRLYYTGTSRTTGGAPNVTRDASWTSTYGLTFQRMLSATPGGTLNGGSHTANSMPTPSNAYMQQYYYPLTTAGTLAGYVRSVLRAGRRSGTGVSGDQRHQAQMVIRVVSADGSTVRGTALAAHNPTSVDSTFFTATTTARKFPASALWEGDLGARLTPVQYQAGDWLVVEIGTRAVVAAQGMGTHLSVNDQAASDLPLNETETANLRSWIEILPPGAADEFQLGGTSSPHGTKTSRLEADPVNTATGNYVSSTTDLALPGIGLPFAFTRTYNSLAFTPAEPARTPTWCASQSAARPATPPAATTARPTHRPRRLTGWRATPAEIT